jgi:hypothetical protein
MMELLEEGICTVVITYSDGSQLEIITTLNDEILGDYDSNYDGFIDLVERLQVPNEVFTEDATVEVYPDMTSRISKLDKFIQKGVKGLWRKI